MNDNEVEIKLWRDYDTQCVGVQIGENPRELLVPDEARKKATMMEQVISDVPEEFRDQFEDQIETIREMADDVEDTNDGG